MWHEKLKFIKLDFWERFVSFLQLLIWKFFHNGSKIYYNPYLLDCYDLKIKTKQAEDTYRRRSIIDLKKIDSVQLFLFTLKCCQKLKELKVENVRVKNIYFWGHTLTNFKSKSWNSKRTFQTTSKTIFTNLNSYFVIKLFTGTFCWVQTSYLWECWQTLYFVRCHGPNDFIAINTYLTQINIWWLFKHFLVLFRFDHG